MNKCDKCREIRRIPFKETIYAMVQEALMRATKAASGEPPPNVAPHGGTEGGLFLDQTISGITIEHGVPIPLKSNVSRWRDVYDKMVPGGSFVAKPSDARSFAYAVSKFGGRTATRTIITGNAPAVRVWLVQKNIQEDKP